MFNFSPYLQNVFNSWFVQIRIQIRSTHCIWLCLSLTDTTTHSCFWHALCHLQILDYSLEFLIFSIYLMAFSWVLANTLLCPLYFLRCSSLASSKWYYVLLIASCQKACDLVVSLLWCQYWSLGLGIGSFVHYTSTPLTFPNNNLIFSLII